MQITDGRLCLVNKRFPLLVERKCIQSIDFDGGARTLYLHESLCWCRNNLISTLRAREPAKPSTTMITPMAITNGWYAILFVYRPRLALTADCDHGLRGFVGNSMDTRHAIPPSHSPRPCNLVNCGPSSKLHGPAYRTP
jgi:hypothetical protein